MKTYKFIQTVYYYYEVEANSIDEAYEKTSELEADDYYDTMVGSWQLMDEEE